MFILDRLLIDGLGFVLDKVATAADSETGNEEQLREDLYAAQMRLELGEIDAAEFAAQEREILAAMRALRQERGQESGLEAGDRISGIEVDYGGDEENG